MVSAVKLGSGSYTYEMVSDWAKLPAGHGWREVAGVAVDSNDRVYVFSRGDHPMNVFDADGKFLKSWGEGVFTRAHGVTMAPDETLFCADDGDHTIRKCTLDGEVLMTLGTPGEAAAPHSGTPFNRCTDVAFDPKTGDFYVSDGYGNSSVHKYSPDGKLLFSWGRPGAGYGEFNIVHNIATDKDGYVYVADRENHRVQVFDSKGNFEAVWANLHRPAAITIADDQTVYVGELGTSLPVSADVPNIGPRVSVLNTNGEVPGASRRPRLWRRGRVLQRAPHRGTRLQGQYLRRRSDVDLHDGRRQRPRGSSQLLQAQQGWLAGGGRLTSRPYGDDLSRRQFGPMRRCAGEPGQSTIDYDVTLKLNRWT